MTIRTGAKWIRPRPGRSRRTDALRGIERACNPVQPFGGLPDFESLITGYASFCAGFAKVAHTTAAIRAYLSSHQVSGIKASGLTISYTLTHRRPTSPT